ncbi:MAG: polyprenyl synthetase family protein, partial [Proteobacteria bacterium]|nr:polyprenyl synthetase family protein [Pseudomonadota bacterium]
HSRAFEMIVDIGNIRVMEILSRATNVIAEGEVQQLSFIRNPATTEAEYMEIISRKTAMLFQAAAHAGAVLAGADEKTEHALRDYGLHLGIAFQMVDDQLDYLGTSEKLGKNIGDDLAEGKVTLPLIIAMRNGQPDQKAFVEDAIRNGGVENLPEMIQLVNATGALKYTSEQANTERRAAMACLDHVADSEFKDSMRTLVNFVVDRHH